MRIDYDAETVTLRIVLDVPVRESEEERSGVIVDYDDSGKLVALEVLDASTRADTVARATTTRQSGAPSFTS
jgi:uncharacterized protein YuzE